MSAGPYDPEALFGQVLDMGDVEQLKTTGNELAHLKGELLAEEDKAAKLLFAYVAHRQLAQYLRERLDSMAGQVTSEHDKARSRVTSIASAEGVSA